MLVGDNGRVTDIPRGSLARTAKLVGLPLGHAGRAALGVGKRVGGRPAEAVAAELQARTAEQLFSVLGQLKGGAMKFGQALSVMEAAMPEELAGAVPGDAHQAAGVRSPDGRRPGARDPRPRARAALGQHQARRVRRRAGRLGLDRPGAQGRLARRARGRRQDPVPRGGRGPDVRPQPALPVRPDGRVVAAGHRRQADHGRAQGADERGARLPPRGPPPAALRDGVPRRRGRARARRARRLPPRARHRVGRRHPAVPDHRLGHPGGARRGRHALPGVPAPGPEPGPAAARRPAPGQLPGHRGRPAGRARLRRRQPAPPRAAAGHGPGAHRGAGR